MVKNAYIDARLRRAKNPNMTLVRITGVSRIPVPPRKNSRHMALTWTGNDTEGNISRGFAAKWAEYEDASVLAQSAQRRELKRLLLPLLALFLNMSALRIAPFCHRAIHRVPRPLLQFGKLLA